MSEWTKEPPTATGWYWRRTWSGPEDYDVKVVRIREYEGVLHAEGDPHYENFPLFQRKPLAAHPKRQWWTTPITPPGATNG